MNILTISKSFIMWWCTFKGTPDAVNKLKRTILIILGRLRKVATISYEIKFLVFQTLVTYSSLNKHGKFLRLIFSESG